VLIGFARREQGLVVAAGDPRGLSSLAAAREKKARLIARPQGAGAQQLLAALVGRERLEIGDFGDGSEAATGPDIGALPLAQLLLARVLSSFMRQRDAFRPPLQKLLKLIGSLEFAASARKMGGLDVSLAGCVRWAP
jgi:putative molybdopterin biosynthesis protein